MTADDAAEVDPCRASLCASGCCVCMNVCLCIALPRVAEDGRPRRHRRPHSVAADAETNSARSGEHFVAAAADRPTEVTVTATAGARPVVWAAFRPRSLREPRRAAAGCSEMDRFGTAVSCTRAAGGGQDGDGWNRPQI
ncbi:hypothetical protein DOTSEDRAFT_70337 [Dothistroma septosporum NZE10]|uniref:Uncharacterized protein n=1 Tax=Dothistroma septosporum (strain NZE10 / CBS 128990) TaxID=675120 RepID=N1PS71_DOTSN|nr:hypothetical protein DOTSEDRAFT_70337 [Dothistroma septosporum NZE10]